MDSVLTISIGVVATLLLIGLILCLRRACSALEQQVKEIAAIPTTLSEVIPYNSDPAQVAEITSLIQRMTNLETFTDSRYKKMAAIDTRLGKHTRNTNDDEEDGNHVIDYEQLAQAVNSGKNPVVEPEEPKAMSEGEVIRMELGL